MGSGRFAKGCSVSMYDWSRSLVRTYDGTVSHPVHVGLWQGCPLSPVLFIIFMDRISRHTLVARGRRESRFGNHRISSLLFADHVVLLASSNQDLQHVLGQFAAECEGAGIRISTSKSKAMVLDRKKRWRALSRWSGGVQVSRGLVHNGEGKMEQHEIDRQIGVGVPDRRGEEGAKSKAEALYLPVSSTLPLSPMVMNFG
ncbi:hypothetical protein L3Q82_006482 [Scortum barcoo]|uniref:Uncharacterized protein n=1 Tax=Scortum barcoo TaxID=214431 RepID=A0ACB8WZJ9_9TELE|nr:hypothetical protein L3Q82_006482 [Scortum barcoo]